MSEQSFTHWSQIKTFSGPAMSLLTCVWVFLQKEQTYLLVLLSKISSG